MRTASCRKTTCAIPYNHTLYRTVNGAMVIKRDGVKFEVFCWFGDIDRGKGELIFKAALRDRVYDGTKRANDCALLEYAYDNPTITSVSALCFPLWNCLSTAFMPGSRIAMPPATRSSTNLSPIRFFSSIIRRSFCTVSAGLSEQARSRPVLCCYP
jgi:hypothetical protein